jgi:hypothetical protein
MLTGKTIGDLDLLGNVTPNTLIPVELNGTTYHIMYSSMTLNSSTEIIYSGNKIDCLSIDTGMDMSQVIESIGDTFCSEPPIFACGDIILKTNPLGECQNPLQNLFNLSILTWCEENPPTVPCNSDVNSLDYLFTQVMENWENENPPSPKCEGINSLDYLFTQAMENWENENPPLPKCEGINSLDYLFTQVIEIWENEPQV